MNKLTSVDYIIFALMFVISLSIGLHQALKKYYKILFKNIIFKRFSKVSTDAATDVEETSGSKINDYLIANGSMTVFPIALSLLATFFSGKKLIKYKTSC